MVGGGDAAWRESGPRSYEWPVALSLLGELEEEEEEEEEGEKFIPDKPGGSVAVFCPLRLFLHTGHVSCWRERSGRGSGNELEGVIRRFKIEKGV